MKNFKFILLIIAALLTSCSKKIGMTSSKIKIFGGNAFSAGSNLQNLANNGLILYGNSNDGKTFAKKIDNESVDLVFPNGVWNFYAVSWEQASADTAFKGVIRCAKQVGLNLNGSDTTINLNLKNSNCSDPSFSSNSYVSSSLNRFPKRSFIGCRNHAAANSFSSTNLCQIENTKSNKGYATSYRVYMPQYKNFGNGLEEYNDSFATSCFTIDSNTTISDLTSVSSSVLDQIGLPDPVNGANIVLRLYYSKNPCDQSTGFDDVVITKNDSPRTKNFLQQSVDNTIRTYYSTPDTAVCKGPRLTTDQVYAGGIGTSKSPYFICTKEQFNNISSNYGSGSEASSFMLLSDLDFKFKNFSPIGHSLETNTSETTPFTGYFYGNDHQINNIFIQRTANIQSVGSELGFIRYASSANTIPQVNNLKLNKVAIIGFEKYKNVGLLAGKMDGSSLYNIGVFGHAEGSGIVGGLVGAISTNPNQVVMEKIIAETDVKAKIELTTGDNYGSGGVVGYASGSNMLTIKNSAIKPMVHGGGDGDFYIKVPQALHDDVGINLEYCLTSNSTVNSFRINNKISNGSSYWLQVNGNVNQNFTGATVYPVSSSIPKGTIIAPEKLKGVGGVIGYSSAIINIQNNVLKSAEIEGAESVGGVVGQIDNTGTIKDIKFDGIITDRQWGALPYTIGAGGIAGKGYSGLIIQDTISTGAMDGNSTDTTSRGAVVGISNSSSVSNSYYTFKNPNSVGGSSTPTTLATLNNKGNLSLGFIDLVGNGNPAEVITTTPSSGTKYFDTLTGFCYIYSASVWNKESGTGLCSTNWYMHADTYDMPKLAVEYLLESQTPFLADLCRDANFYQGTPKIFSDGGRIFCTLSQVLSSAGAVPDHLGKNLYYPDDVTTNASFPSGVYKINGHGNVLYNFKNTSGSGLFTELQAGSILTNFKIKKAVVTNDSSTKSNFGVLANKNYGTIDNVSLTNSILNIDTTSFNPSEMISSTPVEMVGGLVGGNYGLILNGEYDGSVNLSGDNNGGNALTTVYAGGVIGYNGPSATYARHDAKTKVYRYSSLGTVILSKNFHGGLVGFSSGSNIKEVNGDLYFNAQSGGTSYAANYGPVVGYSSGLTTINDFTLNSSIQLSTTTLNAPPDIVFGSGTFNINRGLYRVNNTSNPPTNLPSLGQTANVLTYTNSAVSVNNLLSNLTFNVDSFGNATATGINYNGGANNSQTVDFNGWNYVTSFADSLGSNFTWRIDPMMNGELELVHASGDFDRIGRGF